MKKVMRQRGNTIYIVEEETQEERKEREQKEKMAEWERTHTFYNSSNVHNLVKKINEIGDWGIENSRKVILVDDLCNINTVKAIPIPDNATNGDMIKAMFPNVPVKIFEDMNTVIFGNAQFDLEWWNAPYKRGNLDGSN